MRAVLRLLTLPIRAVITVLIWICALLIRISGKILGLASGLLFLLGLAVLTYSAKNGADGLCAGFSRQPYRASDGCGWPAVTTEWSYIILSIF